MRQSIFLLLIFASISCAAQQRFNLNFEENTQQKGIPDDWVKWGNYDLRIDKNEVFSGEYSVKIDGESSNSFGSIAYKVPSKYEGKKITLEGYMKLENVVGGHAGLLMRLDGDSGVLEFDNMQSQQIKGTLDWKKYSVTLPYNDKTETIYAAGILVGGGKVWFDNFKITVDGKNIQTLKEVEKVKTKGELDDEFHKGSNVIVNELSKQKKEDLIVLGRIWGFLKYHHPAIATGDYNWDYELFRILPKYLKANTIVKRDLILLEWIESYGKVEPCKRCEPINPDANLKPDFHWFNYYKLSNKVAEELKYIQENRFQGEHYYIDFAKGVGNPKFKNEKSYPKMPYPDAGFRLLTLYRFWNMIEYYFPYKHLTDTKWEYVLGNYVESFINAGNELEFELATIQLIGEVNDTHANLWSGNNAFQEWKGEYFPPFHVRFRENQAVVTDYYNSELKEISKLRVGDVITSINGKAITTIIKETKPFYPASNQPTRLRDLGEDLLRSQDSTLNISYISDGIKQNHQLQLYKRAEVQKYRWYKREPNAKSYKWLNDSIGYITLKNIKEEDIKPIKKEFMEAKGIVIDIRNYPSYFVPFALGQFFIEKFTPFARFTKANENTPGEFILDRGVKIPPRGKHFEGKLIVLVNELSQSQAEYTAMAFRATPNCIIIGSTTAGADGNVSRFNLPGGMTSMISGIGVHYPDGSETQRIGIVPDIEVKPTIKGIKEGRDELLEKAIEVINSSKYETDKP